MLKLFLLFAFCSIAFGDDCAKGQYKECDTSIYECCDAAFQQSVGITRAGICKGTTAQDPTCIQDALDLAFYGHGREGVFTVCDAYSAFKQCISPAYQSCTHEKYYLENGWDVLKAKSVEALYSSLNFACGAGMDAFLRNEDCLLSTYNKKFIELYKCSTDFNEKIKREDGNECKYAQNLAYCYNLNFQSCGAESAWWSCERVRTYSAGFAHTCAIDCSNGF